MAASGSGRPVALAAFGCAALLLSLAARADDAEWQPCETAASSTGICVSCFATTANRQRVLSGADSLFNRAAAPQFDAFDPDTPGASAGLNFEHIIAGHASPHNNFTPRHASTCSSSRWRGRTVRLVREAADDPWKMSSTMTYTLLAPYYVDLDFRCRAHDPTLFGRRGYAVLFFANYMNDMEQVALNFLGRQGERTIGEWIAGRRAGKEHADYNGGGTYRARRCPAARIRRGPQLQAQLVELRSAPIHAAVLFGRVAHGMVLILMFDKASTPSDEIRFSLFKFKLDRFPRPGAAIGST